MAEAALVLGVSERQSFRLKARIRKEGVRGVIHGNRGRRGVVAEPEPGVPQQ